MPTEWCVFQERMNRVYVSMVEAVLATPYFYFSYTYDLTHSLQKLQITSPDFVNVLVFLDIIIVIIMLNGRPN